MLGFRALSLRMYFKIKGCGCWAQKLAKANIGNKPISQSVSSKIPRRKPQNPLTTPMWPVVPKASPIPHNHRPGNQQCLRDTVLHGLSGFMVWGLGSWEVVSSLVMGMTWQVMWLKGVASILTKSAAL